MSPISKAEIQEVYDQFFHDHPGLVPESSTICFAYYIASLAAARALSEYEAELARHSHESMS